MRFPFQSPGDRSSRFGATPAPRAPGGAPRGGLARRLLMQRRFDPEGLMHRRQLPYASLTLASVIERVGTAKPPQTLARRLAYLGALASALLLVYFW